MPNPYQFYVYISEPLEGTSTHIFYAMFWEDDRPNAPIGTGESDYLAIINLLEQAEQEIQAAWQR
jgi:hypothetical protein